jgi:hypothetical protein
LRRQPDSSIVFPWKWKFSLGRGASDFETDPKVLLHKFSDAEVVKFRPRVSRHWHGAGVSQFVWIVQERTSEPSKDRQSISIDVSFGPQIDNVLIGQWKQKASTDSAQNDVLREALVFER